MTTRDPNRLARLGVALWTAAGVWSASVTATTLIPVDLVELTASAGAIAQGEVVDVRPEWAPGRRRVQTRVTIAVDEYYKGQLGAQITLVVPGGRIGRYRSVLIGAPRFEVGQAIVVFLGWRDKANPYVIGLSQGLFRVVHEIATGRDVVTPRPLMASGTEPERVRRGDPGRPGMPVGEFRALVRSLVSKVAR